MRDIALMGYARSGKDTAGRYLVENHGYRRVSFADPVRSSLLALDPLVFPMGDMRLSKLVGILGWERAKADFPEVRRLLQAHGTDAVRGVIGDDVWVRVAERKILAAEADGVPVVVTDCRFPNEARELRYRGFHLVWVARPGAEPVNGHMSEIGLGPADADTVITNSGTLADLDTAVSALV